MSLYFIANGPGQTAAAFAGAQTGTAIRTMMQLKLNASANHVARIAEWGISFDGSAAATPIKCELFSTTVAATLTTAFLAADFDNMSDPSAAAMTDGHPFSISTITSAFATAAGTEGTVANARNFDLQFIAPTNQYVKQWPLGREPVFRYDQYVRIRVTAGADRLCYCYMVIEV